MKRLLLLLVFVLGVAVIVFALSLVDYGFYNPPRGIVAAGHADTSKDPREREVLELTVSQADVERFRGQVTLAAFSRFYGADDSLPCSVFRTSETHNPGAATRPLRVGDKVKLCLS